MKQGLHKVGIETEAQKLYNFKRTYVLILRERNTQIEKVLLSAEMEKSVCRGKIHQEKIIKKLVLVKRKSNTRFLIMYQTFLDYFDSQSEPNRKINVTLSTEQSMPCSPS